MQIQFQPVRPAMAKATVKTQPLNLSQVFMPATRFGQNTTLPFTASDALAKAYDHLLNPITAYLPFGIVGFAIAKTALPTLGSRSLVRIQQAERMENTVSSCIPNALMAYNHLREANTISPFGTHYKELDLHAEEITLSDGKRFIPFLSSKLADHLDLSSAQANSRRAAKFMTQLCNEYTGWLKSNGPLDSNGYTLSVKNGKIVADQFKPPSTPTLI